MPTTAPFDVGVLVQHLLDLARVDVPAESIAFTVASGLFHHPFITL